jgi:hypothetical protein
VKFCAQLCFYPIHGSSNNIHECHGFNKYLNTIRCGEWFVLIRNFLDVIERITESIATAFLRAQSYPHGTILVVIRAVCSFRRCAAASVTIMGSSSLRRRTARRGDGDEDDDGWAENIRNSCFHRKGCWICFCLTCTDVRRTMREDTFDTAGSALRVRMGIASIIVMLYCVSCV